MTAGTASKVIRGPGRLVVAPTNLALPYPYGGKEVGRTKVVVLQFLGQSFKVKQEGLGEITEVLESDKRFVFSCFLRGFDDDALKQLWEDNYTLGSVTGHSVYEEPGVSIPGKTALDRARKILFVPDDLINVPAMILYRAIPDWGESAAINWSRTEELGLPFAAECIRDASNRILKIGRLADLTL